MISIVIVDDNFVARRGLRSVLESDTGIFIAGEASNGQEAINLCNSVDPELVLMDIRMPDMDGISATQAILNKKPETKILMLTVIDDPCILANAINAGAAGYLIYGHFSPQELIKAVKTAVAGKAISLPPVDDLFGAAQGASSPDIDIWQRLTQREKEVLNLIGTGCENREIARVLNIEEKTVKNHINSIYSKLGVNTRQEAVLCVLCSRFKNGKARSAGMSG
ncbi:MAG: response regulator transcription factor [Dehalococcoidales bacterium]|mgnify:CR=1 FL=1|nr:response regulator transcription factor [Dehalococcoidales bacterium]